MWRPVCYIKQSKCGLVWLMTYLKRNPKWGHELFSASTALEPNSKFWETNFHHGQNPAPGVSSFVQASEWRKLRNDSVTGPAWSDLLKGLQILGGRVDFLCPFLPVEQDESRSSSKTFRLHSQKIRQDWSLQEERKTLLDHKKGGKEPKWKGYSEPFPCGSAERGKSPRSSSHRYFHLPLARFCFHLGPVPPISDGLLNIKPSTGALELIFPVERSILNSNGQHFPKTDHTPYTKVSLNPPNNLIRSTLLLSPCYKWGNHVPEKWSHPPQSSTVAKPQSWGVNPGDVTQYSQA